MLPRYPSTVRSRWCGIGVSKSTCILGRESVVRESNVTTVRKIHLGRRLSSWFIVLRKGKTYRNGHFDGFLCTGVRNTTVIRRIANFVEINKNVIAAEQILLPTRSLWTIIVFFPPFVDSFLRNVFKSFSALDDFWTERVTVRYLLRCTFTSPKRNNDYLNNNTKFKTKYSDAKLTIANSRPRLLFKLQIVHGYAWL